MVIFSLDYYISHSFYTSLLNFIYSRHFITAGTHSPHSDVFISCSWVQVPSMCISSWDQWISEVCSSHMMAYSCYPKPDHTKHKPLLWELGKGEGEPGRVNSGCVAAPPGVISVRTKTAEAQYVSTAERGKSWREGNPSLPSWRVKRNGLPFLV